MSVSKKTKNSDKIKNINDIIERGGKPTQETEDDKPIYFTMRMPKKMAERIDKIIKMDGLKMPRIVWILSCIQKELNKIKE